MSHMTSMQGERDVLRWGGIAGLVGAALLLITFGVVGAFVGFVSSDPAELVARFPEIRSARIVENGLYLAAIILFALHIAALHEALRATDRAAALFGRVLAMLGLIALAGGALPHIATTPVSDLYHAADASAADQAGAVAAWAATEGTFDTLLVTGLLVLSAGIIVLGWGMRHSPVFGSRVAWLAVAAGVVGVAAGAVNLVEVSEVAALAVFALMLFNLVVGWRMVRSSTEPSRRVEQVTAIQGVS